MVIPIFGDVIFSAVLNKAPYASCLNPHIGVARRNKWFLGFKFRPGPLFDIELNGVRRRQARVLAGSPKLRGLQKGWALKLLSSPVLKVYALQTKDVVRLEIYVFFFRKTWKFTRQAPRLQRKYDAFREVNEGR